jgi:hypothetical protein
MKIGKATRWILVIGIFAILLITAGVAYSRQQTEQTRLSISIAQTQQALAKSAGKYTAQKKDLEARLSQAKSQIAAVKQEFRKPTESIEIDQALFGIADDANVTITSLTTSIPKDEELNGITYKVFSSVSITAEGEVVALLTFSKKVSNEFPAATIESASIKVGGTNTLSLRLKIYAYEGK